jgi:transcriptional regulator with XRE-family HTH domain
MIRDFALTLGKRLVKARTAAGLKQLGVAYDLGVSVNSISYWERGTVAMKVEDLARYATACGTTLATLLEGLDVPKRKTRGGGAA